MTCTKAALWVPNTNSLTHANLTRRQTSDIRRQYILRAMLRRTLLVLVLLPCSTAAQAPGPLRERVTARVAQAPATGVGLTLYRRAGKLASVRELLELMISRGSDPATNILIERAATALTQASAFTLAACAMQF